MKNTLVIIGDSSVMPRPMENIPYEDTYPCLLGKENIAVIDRSIRSADTDYFANAPDDYCQYGASHFVIHLGICDVSPRLLSKREKLWLNTLGTLPFCSRISKYLVHNLRRHRMYFTKRRRITDVPLPQFSANIKMMIAAIRKNRSDARIAIVNIICPGRVLVERSYGIAEQIEEYNREIATLSQSANLMLIDIHTLCKNDPSHILADGHHFDARIHQYIATELRKYIA